MKIKMLSILVFLFAKATVAFAGEKTEKFQVKGNCGMCEKRIEKAALSVVGVSKADWNKETKQMEVTFDDAAASADKVQMAVAKAGHDTGKHKATDKVYNNLPDCCKYDRTDSKSNVQGHEGHGH